MSESKAISGINEAQSLVRAYSYDGKKSGKELSRKKESHIHRHRNADCFFTEYVNVLKDKTRKGEIPSMFDVLTEMGIFALLEPSSVTNTYSISRSEDELKTDGVFSPKSLVMNKNSLKAALNTARDFYSQEDARNKKMRVENLHMPKELLDAIEISRKHSNRYLKMLEEKGIAKECPQEEGDTGILLTFHVFLFEPCQKEPAKKNEEESEVEKTKFMKRIVGTVRSFVNIKNIKNITEEEIMLKQDKFNEITNEKLLRLLREKEVVEELEKHGRYGIETTCCVSLCPMRSDYMKNVVGIIPFKKSVEHSDYNDVVPCLDDGVEFREYNSLVKAEMDFASRNIITEEEREGIDLGDGITVY